MENGYVNEICEVKQFLLRNISDDNSPLNLYPVVVAAAVIGKSETCTIFIARLIAAIHNIFRRSICAELFAEIYIVNFTSSFGCVNLFFPMASHDEAAQRIFIIIIVVDERKEKKIFYSSETVCGCCGGARSHVRDLPQYRFFALTRKCYFWQ